MNILCFLFVVARLAQSIGARSLQPIQQIVELLETCRNSYNEYYIRSPRSVKPENCRAEFLWLASKVENVCG